MSTSLARIEANRANAQLSTGPRTEEGKEVAARNAVRHGFLAGVLPAEHEEYRDLLEELRADLRPQGMTQELLVEQIALGYIRLRRIHAAEMKLMEPRDVQMERWHLEEGHTKWTEELPGRQPMEHFRERPAHLVLRYEASCDRQIQRCLSRLKELKGDWVWKTVRRQAAESADQPEGPAEEVGFVSQKSSLPATAVQPGSPGNGFVSQKRTRRRRRKPRSLRSPSESPSSSSS